MTEFVFQEPEGEKEGNGTYISETQIPIGYISNTSFKKSLELDKMNRHRSKKKKKNFGCDLTSSPNTIENENTLNEKFPSQINSETSTLNTNPLKINENNQSNEILDLAQQVSSSNYEFNFSSSVYANISSIFDKKKNGRRPKSVYKKSEFENSLIMGNNPDIRIEKADTFKGIQVTVANDHYSQYFHKERHHNFVVLENNQDAEFLNGKHYILSVLEKPEEETDSKKDTYCLALKTTPKGSQLFTMTLGQGTRESFVERITLYMKEFLPQINHEQSYYVSQKSFQDQILTIEQKFRQQQDRMKIAILYVKKNQNTPEQWFQNTETCNRFWEFIQIMDIEKIKDITTFNGYKGDVLKGEAYYKNWKPENSTLQKNIECIFHIAPVLDEEEHRRLIGNDMGVIFFCEPGVIFDPSNVGELGALGQVFVVIQPVEEKWRIAFFSNNTIIEHEPPPPINLIEDAMLRNLVLTKLYNGLMATLYSKPLNRLFYFPRSAYIETLCDKLVGTTKEVKSPLKFRSHFVEPNIQQPITLTVRVIGASNLISSPSILLKYFAVVTVKASNTSMKKTMLIASQFPVWNAEFVFTLSGFSVLDLFYEDIDVEIFQKNNGAEELIGFISVPIVSKVGISLSDQTTISSIPKWLNLSTNFKHLSIEGFRNENLYSIQSTNSPKIFMSHELIAE